MEESMSKKLQVAKSGTRIHTQLCSAVKCGNARTKNPNLAFFSFPRDKARCKKWIDNCGRTDLDKRDMRTICGKLTLCEEHFEHNQFMNPSEKGIFKPRKRLIHTAVPTIFNTLRHPPHHATIRTLPPFGNQEHITTHATKAGHILFESSLGDKDYVSENIYVDEYCQSDDGTCSEKISGVQFVSSCSDDVVVSCKEIASSSYDDYVRTPCDQITPDDDKLSNESKTKRMSVVVDSGNELLELQRLRRLLHCARLKLYRLKKKEADRRMNPEKVSVKKFLEMGEIFFSEPAFTFLKYLVKVSSNSGKQSQWTKEYKMLALSIYHTSSKAYILLKNVLSLPSIRTLQRLKRDL